MNRREFLKWAGVTAAVVAVPALAKGTDQGTYPRIEAPNFDPSQIYGNYVELTDSMKTMPMSDRKRIYRVVEDNMNSFIPPEYRHKVTYLEKECFPNDEGVKATLAWKYKP